jgi:hypothetical protein
MNLNPLLTEVPAHQATKAPLLSQTLFLRTMSNGVVAWNEREKLMHCTYTQLSHSKIRSRNHRRACRTRNGQVLSKTSTTLIPESILVHLDHFVLYTLPLLGTMAFIRFLLNFPWMVSEPNLRRIRNLYHRGSLVPSGIRFGYLPWINPRQ